MAPGGGGPTCCAKAWVSWVALPRMRRAVLLSVASTSTWVSAPRPRRISRPKCVGMMSAARTRPVFSILSGDIGRRQRHDAEGQRVAEDVRVLAGQRRLVEILDDDRDVGHRERDGTCRAAR